MTGVFGNSFLNALSDDNTSLILQTKMCACIFECLMKSCSTIHVLHLGIDSYCHTKTPDLL